MRSANFRPLPLLHFLPSETGGGREERGGGGIIRTENRQTLTNLLCAKMHFLNMQLSEAMYLEYFSVEVALAKSSQRPRPN